MRTRAHAHTRTLLLVSTDPHIDHGVGAFPGLVVNHTLEVTNCFPFPSRSGGEGEEDEGMPEIAPLLLWLGTRVRATHLWSVPSVACSMLLVVVLIVVCLLVLAVIGVRKTCCRHLRAVRWPLRALFPHATDARCALVL